MTRSELHQAILDGKTDIKDVSTKKLRELKVDFDMGYEPDFLEWLAIWKELDKREFKQAKTQDDVNRMHEAFKKRKVKIKKDFY
jgi:hypothetical protein